jgi:hypothetical protein
MTSKHLEAAVLTAVLGLCLSTAVAAQTRLPWSPTAEKEAASPKTSKKTAKLPLKDITFMSTSEAAREAAEATKAKPQGQTTLTSGQAGGNGILEFQPVQSESAVKPESSDTLPEHRKKPLFKDIHGSVYGSTSSQRAADHTTAGNVGASSRNGTFSIFVGTEHSQASNPGQH